MSKKIGTPVLYFNFERECWIVNIAPLIKCFKKGLCKPGIMSAKRVLADGFKIAKKEYERTNTK